MSVARSDEGSILPLIAGFGAVCLALVLVVTAATSLYLERKRLFTVADSAALAAAESFDAEGASRGPGLATAQVEDAVSRYLISAAPDFESLRIEHAAAIDATSATVTLSAIWHPPVVSAFVPDGMRIEVTTTGRTVYF
jgi:uncharacterized membrane protein